MLICESDRIANLINPLYCSQKNSELFFDFYFEKQFLYINLFRNNNNYSSKYRLLCLNPSDAADIVIYIKFEDILSVNDIVINIILSTFIWQYEYIRSNVHNNIYVGKIIKIKKKSSFSMNYLLKCAWIKFKKTFF